MPKYTDRMGVLGQFWVHERIHLGPRVTWNCLVPLRRGFSFDNAAGVAA